MIHILLIASDYSLVANPNVNTGKAITGLVGFIFLALKEEIVFRGYPFLKLQKIFRLRIIQIVIAILFAYYHDETGATLLLQLMGPGVWELIYGIASVWSKGIAMPTGIHAAVNMVLALVGTNHEVFAIWNIEAADENAETLAQFNSFRMILQVLLFLLGIGLTEWWI